MSGLPPTTSGPVRVLYVLNDLGGGASQGIYEMLRALPRDQFIAYAAAPASTVQALERMRPLFAGVKLFVIPWWNINRQAGVARRFAITLGRWVRGGFQRRCTSATLSAIREWKIDLVHSATALTVNGALAGRAASIPHLWHIKESIGKMGRLNFPMQDVELVRFMSQHSAFVVAMTEYVAKPFRAHACPNLEVLPDGVDVAPFRRGATRNLRKRLGLGPETPLIGMVASLTSTWKQHDVFIRAADVVARRDGTCRFVIVGKQARKMRWPHDLGYGYLQQLRRLTHELGIEDRLDFVDFVPDPPDLMRSLDLLVHTCSTEPFGRVAIEAMAAGVPVVGPASGGIAESVLDGETGLLVTPDDPAAFAEGITRILTDPDLRRRLSQSAQRHSAQSFSLQAHTERQADLYLRALRQHPSDRALRKHQR